MVKISVWYPDTADGVPLEVQMYGVFNNKTVTDVDGPVYVRDPMTGDLVETDFLVIGLPIEIGTVNSDPDGGKK
jgi:hypothetical protein